MEINSKYLGIICITLAQACFTTQDMGIKFISGDYALHQITLIRAIVAILFTLLVFNLFSNNDDISLEGWILK